jgi:hypothetical protein
MVDDGSYSVTDRFRRGVHIPQRAMGDRRTAAGHRRAGAGRLDPRQRARFRLRTGEHTIHLAALGYDVRGVDSSELAIDQARANAARREVAARFEVADALQLGDQPTYDTVIDSALFHIFDLLNRDRYIRSLYRVCTRTRWSTSLRCPTPGADSGRRSATR